MPLPLWKICLLAAVQGIAEFLPISSSGHIVILADLLSPQNAADIDVVEVNVALHLGTLASILVFYRYAIWELLRADYRTIALLVVGTVPAVLVGVPIKLFLEDALSSSLVSGALLIVTGLMLIWASRRATGDRSYQRMSFTNAALIGVAQAAAILPGLSRSGSTISAGFGLGLSSKSAGTFSFLLAIPAIAGGGVLESISMLRHGETVTTPLAHLAIGAAIAFVVGFVALSWLVRWLESGRFCRFAWWCIPVGLATLTWQIITLI